MSGLNQQFAKLPYLYRVPGVRIPPSPQEKMQLKTLTIFDYQGFFIVKRIEIYLIITKINEKTYFVNKFIE